MFEKISHIDSIDGHRPTNFDFYFKTQSGKKFYFEIKYTEQEFGRAPKSKNNTNTNNDTHGFDMDHIQKYKQVYSKHLGAISPHFANMHNFLSHYQVMRNLIHVDANSYVVFVYPKDNIKVKQGAEKAKKQLVVDKYSSHVFTLEWENLYAFVNQNINTTKLTDQMSEFKRKYFID